MSDVRPWRVLSSETIHADGWISLRADRCLTAQGVEVSPYYVLEYPDWVHVVALGPRDQVLLVEQYRHAAGVVTLELPAGRMDPDDDSPETTARRELLEETGCRAERTLVVNKASPNPASHNNQVHTILALGVRRHQSPKEDPREQLRVRWVAREDALRLAADGVLPAMQAASLFAAFLKLSWLAVPAAPSATAD